MGFLSSISSGFSSLGSGVKKLASTATSNIKNFTSTVASKAQSATKIVGTNIKNSVSKESLQAFAKGFAQGGLIGGIAQAGMNTAVMSMTELDKSGDWNPDYLYKKYDFPSKAEFEEALSYGYDNYSSWKEFKESISVPPQTVVSAEVGGSGATVKVDGVGEATIKSLPSGNGNSAKDGIAKVAVVGALAKLFGFI